MHIPDGFVSCPINQALGALALGAVGYGLYIARAEQDPVKRTLPLMGMTASFIFAAQMLNFPINSGTSGHFLGGALAASLLGGWNACLILASVLIVQCFAFADGGLSALGTNIVNMGIVGGLGTYGLMRLLRMILPKGVNGFLITAAVSSCVSVILASAACSLELALSGSVSASNVFPAMVGTHALIGLGEAGITTAALVLISMYAPTLLPQWAGCNEFMEDKEEEQSGAGLWTAAGAGILVSLALAAFASPFASSSPDGLEKVAEDQGFLALAEEATALWQHSPWPDYAIPTIASEGISTALAGISGTILTFGLSLLLAALFMRTKPAKEIAA